MNKKILSKQSLAAAAAMFVLPMAAMAHDYTFAEGGFVSVDNGPADDNGYFLGGSVNIAPNFAVIGEWNDIDQYSQISGGLLFHTPLNNVLDLNVGATLEHGEVDGPGPSNDDTGFGVRAGVRYWAMPGKVELIPEIRYVDLFNTDSTSLRGTALFRVTPPLDLQAFVQGGDDDRFGLGVRYNFGS